MQKIDASDSEKPGSFVEPVSQPLEHSDKLFRRECLYGFLVFLIIWVLSLLCVRFARGPRSLLPRWTKEICEDVLTLKQDEFAAESDIYAEEKFSFIILDPFDIPLALNKLTDSPESEKNNGEEIEDNALNNENIAPFEVEVIGEAKTNHLNWAFIQKQKSSKTTTHSTFGKYMIFVKGEERVVKRGEPLYTTCSDGEDERRVYTPAFYRLLAYYKYHEFISERRWDAPWFLLRFSVASALVVLGFIATLSALRESFFARVTRLWLCCVCFVLHILIAMAGQWIFHKLNAGSSFYLFAMLPLELGASLGANLLGRRVGMILALWCSVLTPILVGGDFIYQLFFYALFSSLFGVLMFSTIQKRIQFIWGFIVKLFCVHLFSLLFALQRDIEWIWEWNNWGKITLFGLGSALVFVFLLHLLPWILEHIFDVTTVFTLNELNTRDHRLLKRLQVEAPGTYQHSEEVARLAKDAAEAAGYNAKLAEVCSLFHDVGKLFDPKKFAENLRPDETNPHDSLTPEESCALLREHVKYGIELVRKAHLPHAICEAVEQHHGSGLMAGFYNKACREADASGTPMPPKEKFSYRGQRPVRPEVVIIALADSCEAAVRACANKVRPDWQLIRKKVEDIVQTRFLEGQLDEAEIPVAKLRVVVDSLVNTLCIIHLIYRPEYSSASLSKEQQEKREELSDVTESKQTELSEGRQ